MRASPLTGIGEASGDLGVILVGDAPVFREVLPQVPEVLPQVPEVFP